MAGERKSGKAGQKSLRQDILLPFPMREIPVEKLDFEPNADNSCISVEGPQINEFVSLPPEVEPDAFTTCGLKLFESQLKGKFKNGTQSTDETLDSLTQCFKASAKPKRAIIIGHGAPGRMATGNGPSPGSNQSFNQDDTAVIATLRSLNSSELLLFSCDTGVGPSAMKLLNSISERFPTRARNSQVMCSLDETQNGSRKGLYVFKGPDQPRGTAKPKEPEQRWVTAKPNDLIQTPVDEASVVIDQGSCFALKGTDRLFHVTLPDEFKRKKERGDISLLDFRSEIALRQGVYSESEALPSSDLVYDRFPQLLAADKEWFDDIDFCQVLREGMAPSGGIVGNFVLKVDGQTRRFYALSGGLVQDADHPEVYYPMKPEAISRLSSRVRQKWHEMLLQQMKLLNELEREDKKPNR